MKILEPLEDVQKSDFEVIFPSDETHLSQDEEWCLVRDGSTTKRLRFHDYDQIFAVPGLYEHLFYETLECCSPTVVCDLLTDAVGEDDFSELRLLDVGAGNGMVGEEMRVRGVEEAVGLDLIEEAADAAQRDRPGVYSSYFVADLTALPAETERRLRSMNLNCMTVVAALGFGDIPPHAFIEAYNLIEEDGWVAFNIRDKFLDTAESSGFSRLIESMFQEGLMDMDQVHRRKYRHRLSIDGEPLFYYAFAARKRAHVPPDWALESTMAESTV